MRRLVNLSVPVLLAAGLSAWPAHAQGTKPGRLLPDQRTDSELAAFLRSKVPPLIIPDNPEDWAQLASDIRARLVSEIMLRGVPESWTKGKVNVVWGDAISQDGYLIRKLRYEAAPGLWIGALLYEPADLKQKVPGVLSVNGHVGAPGNTIDYKQALNINLARRGMLVLSAEWIGMGQLSGPGYGHDDQAYLDLCGRAGVSVFYLSLKRALDVLTGHEHSDPERVAVTGLSGGGWQTITISALDTRVTLCAPNAGYIGMEQKITYAMDVGDLEQNPVDQVAVADHVQLTSLMAPQPVLLIYNEKDECCFPAARARTSLFDPLAPLYKKLGHENALAFHENKDPGTHNYLEDNRRAFYRFLGEHFFDGKLPHGDKELHTAVEILPAEKLAIEYPEKNGSFLTLAAQAMEGLPRHPAPRDVEQMATWRQQTRSKLRQVIRPPDFLGLLAAPLPEDTVAPTSAILSRPLMLQTPDKSWSLPGRHYEGHEHKGITLIISDEGFATTGDLMRAALARGDEVLAFDLFLTGECATASTYNAAQLLGAVGQRPLGLQVSQLNLLVKWSQTQIPEQKVRLVTRGKMCGLAGLVVAALYPNQIERLELHGAVKSFKKMMEEQIGYRSAPSLFCFGLLETVDVPDLVELARPAEVEFAP